MLFSVISIVLAIIPALILTRYFQKRDPAPEPSRLLWKIFFIGFFSVLPAAAIELFFSPAVFWGQSRLQQLFAEAFVIAGLVEEGLKLAVVWFFVYPRREFDEIGDGIVYTIAASMGFACFENIMYSAGSPVIALIRGLTAVPLHAAASGIMGYYIGRSKFTGERTVIKGLLMAVIIHGSYNFLLFLQNALSFLILPLLFLAGRRLLRLHRRAVEEDREAGRLGAL